MSPSAAAPGLVFADSSVLVKVFIHESDSDAVRERLRGVAIGVSTLTWAEMHAALARRRREGTLSVGEYRLMLDDFGAVWNGCIEVGLDHAVHEQVAAVVAKYPLRAGDAVQLGSALVLREAGLGLEFATADLRLAWAAEAEGLRVWGTPAAPPRGAIVR